MSVDRIYPHVKLGFQFCKMFLEQTHYFGTHGLPPGNVDTLCGTRSDVDQLTELGMLEGLNWL
jgi:hypothetical protein